MYVWCLVRRARHEDRHRAHRIHYSDENTSIIGNSTMNGRSSMLCLYWLSIPTDRFSGNVSTSRQMNIGKPKKAPPYLPTHYTHTTHTSSTYKRTRCCDVVTLWLTGMLLWREWERTVLFDSHVLIILLFQKLDGRDTGRSLTLRLHRMYLSTIETTNLNLCVTMWQLTVEEGANAFQLLRALRRPSNPKRI